MRLPRQREENAGATKSREHDLHCFAILKIEHEETPPDIATAHAFNDVFGGGARFFAYEELPAGGRKTGITGRGLEGLTDAALKVFGI